MNKFIFFLTVVALITIISCKKTYTCTCSTTPAASTNTFTQQQSGGYYNQAHYSVDEFNKENAQTTCENSYVKSGLVVNGYSCTVYDGSIK